MNKTQRVNKPQEDKTKQERGKYLKTYIVFLVGIFTYMYSLKRNNNQLEIFQPKKSKKGYFKYIH